MHLIKIMGSVLDRIRLGSAVLYNSVDKSECEQKRSLNESRFRETNLTQSYVTLDILSCSDMLVSQFKLIAILCSELPQYYRLFLFQRKPLVNFAQVISMNKINSYLICDMQVCHWKLFSKRHQFVAFFTLLQRSLGKYFNLKGKVFFFFLHFFEIQSKYSRCVELTFIKNLYIHC